MSQTAAQVAYQALFVAANRAIVGFLRNRLSEDEVVASERLERQEERRQDRQAPKTVWEDVDLDKTCHLLETYRLKVLPLDGPPAQQLQRRQRFQDALSRLRRSRRRLAHPSPEAAMTVSDAEACVAAAQETLVLLGITRTGLTRYSAALARMRREPKVRRRSQSGESLPPRRDAFGRRLVVNSVTELIKSGRSRLIFLTGQSGIGKTTIAIEVAHQIKSAFEDRVHFVSLERAVKCEELDRAIASLSPRNLQSSRRGHLLPRRAVILDNFEVVDQCALHLAQLAERDPRTIFLCTTTKSPDIASARVVPIESLGVPRSDDSPGDVRRNPSVELFLDQREAAGGTRVSESEVGVVASICRRLEGVPLAIELAARQSALLPLETLDRELQGILRTPSGLDRPKRHQSIPACVRWTMSRVTRQQRRLLGALAIFLHPISIESIAPALLPLGFGAGVALRETTELIRSGLLHLEGERVYMLEMVRMVAADEISEDEGGLLIAQFFDLVGARLRRVLANPGQPLTGELTHLPQLCTASIPMLIFSDTGRAAAVVSTWAGLSLVRDEEFGRHDAILLGLLEEKASHKRPRLPQPIRGEMLVRLSSLQRAYSRPNAWIAALDALKIGCRSDDRQLAERAGLEFEESAMSTSEPISVYRKAIAAIQRRRINDTTLAALDSLLEMPTGRELEEYVEWAGMSGIARQQIAYRLLRLGKLEYARIETSRAIDELQLGLGPGAKFRRFWRRHVNLARQLADPSLVAYALNAWAISELGYGEYDPSLVLHSRDYGHTIDPAQLRFALELARRACNESSNRDSALLIASIGILMPSVAVANEGLSMLLTAWSDDETFVSNVASVLSALAAHESDGSAPFSTQLLDRVAEWLAGNGNLSAAFAVGSFLASGSSWLRKAARKLHRSEKIAALSSLKGPSFASVTDFALNEVNRVPERRRTARRRSIGLRITGAAQD